MNRMILNDLFSYLSTLTDAQWKTIEHVVDLLTLVIIFWTAYETFRARRANNKAIEISTLPVLLIDFRKKNGKYTAFIKNFRDIPAYDIKVEKWLTTLNDVQVTWSMDIRNKDFNLIEGNKEKELALIFKENDSIIGSGGNEIIMHSVFGSGLPLSVEYRNFLGERYYTYFRITRDPETNENVLEMIKHPTKVGLTYYSYKIGNVLNGFFIRTYFGFVWKIEKPHFAGDAYKYDIFSVVRRYLKNRKKSQKTQ